MVLLSILIQFFSVVISTIIIGRTLNMVTLFNTVWFIGIVGSSVGLNGLYIPSSETFTIILYGILAFNCGAIICVFINCRKKIDYSKKKINSRDTINITNWSILLIITLILLIPFIIRALNITLTNDYSYIRANAYLVNGPLLKNIFDLYVIQWIVEPIIYSSQILIAVNFIKGNFLIKQLSIILLLTFMYSFSFGGRIVIIRFLLFMLFSFLFLKWKKIKTKIKRKHKLILLLISVICILFIISSSNARAGKELSIIKQFIDYFIGPVVMMDVTIPKINLNFNSFSLILLGGILDFIRLILNFFLGTGFRTSAIIYSSFTATFVNIGDKTKYNALATVFTAFYLDFGIISVFIYSFLFGYISLKVYFYYINKRNLFSQSLYLMFLYCIYISIQRWELLMSWPILSLFFLKFLLIKKQSSPKIVFDPILLKN